MNSRERVINTLTQQKVDRLPRDLWYVPYIPLFRKDELDRLLESFPTDFIGPKGIRYGKSHYAKGEPYRMGGYVDEFGSCWEVKEEGVTGEVKDPPIKTIDDLNKYRLPYEMLEEMDVSGQAQAYKETGSFVLAGTFVRPFERLQFLMGTEQLFINMAMEDKIFIELLERLHEFNLREMKAIAAQAVDGISFMDDWGTQRSLLISPAMWRKFFKPLYKEYCDIIRNAGKFVFFHTDGFIEEVYGDLIEIGVHALNSQLFCMDIEALGEKYRGKVTFWGEISRQDTLPFGTTDDVRVAVRRIGNNLLGPNKSGIIAECSWETVSPFENVEACYDEFNKLI